MEKVSFSDGIGIAGIIFAVVLLVLDKAGKLKGGWLVGLLVLAGLMTLFVAIGNAWVLDAPSKWKLWRVILMFSLVALTYSGIAIWITGGGESPDTTPPSVAQNKPEISPPPAQNYPLIEASWEERVLPFTIPPRTTVGILAIDPKVRLQPELFTNDKSQDWVWPTQRKIPLPDVYLLYKISNHDSVRVFNLKFKLICTLNFSSTGAKGQREEGKFFQSGTAEFITPSLGPGESFLVYVVNQSAYWATVPLPDSTVLEIEGSSEKHTVKMVPHGALADIELPAGYPSPSTIPGILPPSAYKWNGNKIVFKSGK
jgi:hypothetical protein